MPYIISLNPTSHSPSVKSKSMMFGGTLIHTSSNYMHTTHYINTHNTLITCTQHIYIDTPSPLITCTKHIILIHAFLSLHEHNTLFWFTQTSHYMYKKTQYPHIGHNPYWHSILNDKENSSLTIAQCKILYFKPPVLRLPIFICFLSIFSPLCMNLLHF